VLEDARLDMVCAGHAVGSRRPLVERPPRAALGRREAAGEDLPFTPQRDDLVIERGEVDVGRQRLIAHRGGASLRVVRTRGTTSRAATARGTAVPPSLACRGRPPSLAV